MAQLNDAVPESVRDTWENFHGFTVPDEEEMPEEIRKIYQQGADGLCMTCGAVVQEEALVVVNVTGINQLYCSHKCMQDMQVLGYLSQQYDDIAEAVKFRGSEGHDG